MTTKKANPRTVAYNIIAEHGKDKFQMLIDMFRANESGTKIGTAFGVSRQRVSQWRNTLGKTTVHFDPDPVLEDLIDGDESRGLNRQPA